METENHIKGRAASEAGIEVSCIMILAWKDPEKMYHTANPLGLFS